MTCIHVEFNDGLLLIPLLASAAYISSTGRFFTSGFRIDLWRHPIHPSSYHLHDPQKVPPYLSMYTERSRHTPPFTHRIVRLFFQLPAFSTIGGRILACRRYCKSLIFACASINMPLVIVVLLLEAVALRFLLSVFFVLPAMGSRIWCACCSCSAVTILRYIAIGCWCRLFTFMSLGVPGNGVLVVLFLFCTHGHGTAIYRYWAPVLTLGVRIHIVWVMTTGPADFYLLSSATSYCFFSLS